MFFNLVYDRWPCSIYNMWWQKWHRLQQVVAAEPDRPLLVVLGSSRAGVGVQAELLHDLPGPGGKHYLAYNFAVPATAALGEVMSLQEMLDAGIRPRLVLAEFVSPLLNEMRKGYVSEEYWMSAGRLSLRQLRRLEPYLARPDHVWRDWLEARLAPWSVLRPYLQRWGEEALFDRTDLSRWSWDTWGHHALQEQSLHKRLELRGLADQQYRKSLENFELGRGPAQAMHDLLARCRREDIPVVLVVMPESPWFHRLYSPAAVTALHHFLAQLRDEYDVAVIDATGWEYPTAFVDGHHMRAGAARRFTLRLRGELQRILAAKTDCSGSQTVLPNGAPRRAASLNLPGSVGQNSNPVGRGETEFGASPGTELWAGLGLAWTLASAPFTRYVPGSGDAAPQGGCCAPSVPGMAAGPGGGPDRQRLRTACAGGTVGPPSRPADHPRDR
jgi:hypothetical protein